MIKCNKGSVSISGNAADILAEYSTLTYAIYSKLVEAFDKEEAKKYMDRAYKLAYEDNSCEIPDEIKKDIEELVDMLMKKLRS